VSIRLTDEEIQNQQRISRAAWDCLGVVAPDSMDKMEIRGLVDYAALHAIHALQQYMEPARRMSNRTARISNGVWISDEDWLKIKKEIGE
jgi:hypothetical protein